MKKYTIILLVSLLMALILVAGVNWMVNPFDIFDSPEYEKFNKYKPAAARQARINKIYQVKKQKPDYIILGTSRALALPDDYLVPVNMRGFNLALASSSIYEQLRMFQHAHAINKQKRVVIGIDESLSISVQQNFSEDRIAVTVDGDKNSGWSYVVMQDVLNRLFSLDALRASYKTVKNQPKESIEHLLKQDKIKRVYGAGGHKQMFLTMEASVLKNFPGAGGSSCYKSGQMHGEDNGVAMSYFKAMLELAYSDDVEFYIFFSPVHARIYETWCVGGLWGVIENTKREIVTMVEQIAELYGKQPFPIWDFSGYNIITTEPVPEFGDRQTLMYGYWEGSHYTHAVARLILERMFEEKTVLPADFGVMITSDNIEQHLQKIHQQHLKYLQNNPDDIEEIISLVSGKNINR